MLDNQRDCQIRIIGDNQVAKVTYSTLRSPELLPF